MSLQPVWHELQFLAAQQKKKLTTQVRSHEWYTDVARLHHISSLGVDLVQVVLGCRNVYILNTYIQKICVSTCR